jgi:hypothetical protein
MAAGRARPSRRGGLRAQRRQRQRLYYYLCELQRRGCARAEPLLYDVANLARPSSFEHTLESTRLLAAQLGSAADRSSGLQRVRRRESLAHAVRRIACCPRH